MAKIDTSKITGYAEMSAEDKLKALEAFEYEDNVAELEKQKAAVSKANSEAAEWKRKHNALLGEDEKKKQEQEEKFANMEKELSELREAKRVSEFKAKFARSKSAWLLRLPDCPLRTESARQYVVLTSPAGKQFKVTISDNGELSTTPSLLPVPEAVLARWITPRKSRKHGQTVILPPLLTTPACKPKRKRRRKKSKGEFLLWQISLL